MESGDSSSADRLLPLVYEELRWLAAASLASEKPGQTLEATALVHEAYLKLVDGDARKSFANRRHFFASAAEAMRQILVDQARRKLSVRHGGEWHRLPEPPELAGPAQDPAETVAIGEFMMRLGEKHPRPAQFAKMRLFLQMTFAEIAEVLGVSADTAEADWAYARAWLKRQWQVA
jgi:RNA polymerase sigma factor (TIGR02999 family)